MQYKVHYPYLTFIIDTPLSIDDFFSQMHLSKKTIHLLKQNKEYTVNKRYVSSSTILLKGDHLTIKAFQHMIICINLAMKILILYMKMI